MESAFFGAVTSVAALFDLGKECIMGLLVIKRKKQFGKAFENPLKVIIDKNQTIEIANGETKKIDLEDGTHSINFLYEFDADIPFFSGVLTNCEHQEEICLQESTEYTVSIGLGQFKIKRDGNSKKTTSRSNDKMANFLKIYCGFSISFILSLSMFFIGLELIRNYFMSFLSFSIHTIIFMLVPSIIFVLKIYRCVPEDSDKIFSDFKYCFKLGLIATGIFTAVTIIVSLLFRNGLESYAIISSIAALVVEIIVIKSSFDRSIFYITVAIASVVVIVLSLLMSITKDGGNNGSDDKCASCNGSGMVIDGFLDFNTCPTCRGSGLPPH